MMRIVEITMVLGMVLYTGAKPSYNVVAPRTIRPNTNYFVAISVDGTDGELQDVECRIYGQSASGQSIEIKQTSRVPPGDTQMVRMSIGELGNGNYRFEAKGLTPIEFTESTPLDYLHKGYSVFIQTDKAIYRPGNEVQFRTVVLSPQLKPSVTGSIDIKMTDGAGNLIRDWNRVFTSKGVWAGSLEISPKPVLGNWNISVDVNGQVFVKTFQVAEYILPKFQVDIDIPTYATFTDTVTATIKANYALGRPVKGTATVAVFPRYKSGYLQPIFSEPLRQVIDISGKVDVEFKLAKELKLSDEYSKEIVFDVVVEEDKTQRRQNNTNSLTLYKYPYKLELVKTADAFKPGMPYTCFLKLSYQDGKPVMDDLNPVSVKSGFGADTESYEATEYPIPENGIIRLAFVAPKDPSVQVLGIEAKYRDLSQWFSTVPRSESSTGLFIQARLASENPTVNRNVKFAVTSSEPLDTFRYEVLGRGNIVWAATVRGSGETHNEITLQATRDMSPRARIIVSYTRPDGEIVADAMDFEVDGFLSNSLEINLDRKQIFPGETVDIELRAKPNSFIGVLAIDRSVRSLKAGHDIVKDDLLSEIKSYDAGQETSFYPWVQSIKNDQGSLYWYTGSSSNKLAYEESGVFILTNGYLTQGQKEDSTERDENTGENRPIGRPIQPPGASIVKADQGPGVVYETATRPPLAGPYAFSRLPRPADDLPKIYLRNDLPPTWLFTNTSTNSEGNGLITVQVPDLTNTTWVVSGFSINQLDGMGISETLAELELFQPFYVLANIPYSVRVGETVAVEMVVFNYLRKEISAEVTLENPNGSGFIFGSPNPNEIEDNELPTIELHRTKRITIRPLGRTPVSFIITPQEIGNLEIKITAKSSFGQDILLEKLRVEAEGEIMYKSDSYLVDLTNKGELELNITVNIPKHAVPKSSRVFVAAVPDPVGPAINNLEDLLQYPTGCGEQNLESLLPSVILLDYLQEVGRSTPSIVNRAKHIMQLGYQRQLVYRHKDGSFSPFGKTDRAGTVWLTAQTAGTLQGVSKYIDVDGSVIEKALLWLVDNQQGDGSYKETGPVTHRVQENPVTLTAFTILGYLDNKRNLTSSLRNSMNKAIDYIALNWETLTDPYDLSIVAYTLHKSIHPSKDPAWTKLESLAQTEGDKKWWQKELSELEQRNPWHKEPNTGNIEMTSYALLCLTERGGISDAVPVTNWLFSQQNANGGFASTSDTYAALKALTEFSKGFEVQNRNTDMNIQYEFLGTVRRIKVSSESATTMQKRILPEETREVKIRATGSGISVIEVGYQYNLNVTAAWPSFVVNPQVTKVSDSNHMQVTVCAHYIEKTNRTGSNMAVMEVNLPSGFTANQDSLPALRRHRGVKRVDTEKSDTKVILYFDSLTKREVCPTIEAFRTHRVANQKPAPVLVYDYYDQSARARSFYDVVPATLCDICEEEDCPDDGCPDRPTFPNFGSYAFREAYYAESTGHHSGISVCLVLIGLLSLFAMERIQ